MQACTPKGLPKGLQWVHVIRLIAKKRKIPFFIEFVFVWALSFGQFEKGVEL